MDRNTDGDLRTLGEMVTSFEVNPVVRLNSPYWFPAQPPERQQWMVFWEVQVGEFDANRQIAGDSEQDLGARVRYAYLTPVFAFHNGGGLAPCVSLPALKGLEFTVGVGIGVGYLQAEGDMILTEVQGTPRVDISEDTLGMATFVFFDLRGGAWQWR